MRYCSNCGTQGTDGQAYCGACGTPFPADSTQAIRQSQPPPPPQPPLQTPLQSRYAPQPQPPPQTWPRTQTQPAAPRPGYQYGAPRMPDFDWRKIVVGNWVGAAITAPRSWRPPGSCRRPSACWRSPITSGSTTR